MTSRYIRGKINIPAYRGTPAEFVAALEALDLHLQDAKEARVARLLDYPKRRFARAEADLRKVVSDGGIDGVYEYHESEIAQAKNDLDSAAASAAEEVLPVVSFRTDKLDISASQSLSELPKQGCLSSRSGFTVRLQGQIPSPTISVSTSWWSPIYVHVTGSDPEWVKEVLATADREFSQGKPWWWWLKHWSATVVAFALYAFFFLVAVLGNSPSIWLVFATLVVSLITIAGSVIPRVLIRENRVSVLNRVMPLLKWVASILLSAVTTYFLVEFFG